MSSAITSLSRVGAEVASGIQQIPVQQWGRQLQQGADQLTLALGEGYARDHKAHTELARLINQPFMAAYRFLGEQLPRLAEQLQPTGDDWAAGVARTASGLLRQGGERFRALGGQEAALNRTVHGLFNLGELSLSLFPLGVASAGSGISGLQKALMFPVLPLSVKGLLAQFTRSMGAYAHATPSVKAVGQNVVNNVLTV